MKNYLKVDDRNRCLIMDRMFDKNRKIVGSKEYDLLQMAKADHPQYEVVLRHIKSNPEKQIYKHLTYDYMREYISRHPHAKERMEEFDEKILRSRCHAEKYPKVKEWFLAAYPDISDFSPMEFKEIQDKEITAIENFEVFEPARVADSTLPLAG